jgi:hypothetical protein
LGSARHANGVGRGWFELKRFVFDVFGKGTMIAEGA